jgi:hypothetical protein
MRPARRPHVPFLPSPPSQFLPPIPELLPNFTWPGQNLNANTFFSISGHALGVQHGNAGDKDKEAGSRL